MHARRIAFFNHESIHQHKIGAIAITEPVQDDDYTEHAALFCTAAAGHWPASYNGNLRILGSASLLLPGLYLTARHLVHEWYKDTGSDNMGDPKFMVRLAQIVPPEELVTYSIGRYVMDVDDRSPDLALLITHYVEPEKLKLVYEHARGLTPGVNCHPLDVGDEITLCGFLPSNGPVQNDGSTTHYLKLSQAKGIVEEVHWNGVGLSRGPTYQVNAKLSGGMSGGPAFNSNGQLVGVNVSSFDLADGQAGNVSFVAMPWGIFGHQFEVPFQDGVRATSLLELCQKKFIKSEGLCHLGRMDSGLIYHNWSRECADCVAKALRTDNGRLWLKDKPMD